MRKKILFFLLNFSFLVHSFSKPVDVNTAKIVGNNFMKTQLNSNTFGKNSSLELVYTSVSISKGITEKTSANYFFVFNINQNNGFIIVSADDVVLPILAYSDEKGFEPNNIPEHVESWLEGYSSQIGFVIDNNLLATPEISKQWADLYAGTIGLQKLNKKGAGEYLVKTKWNQWPYYNDLCPLYDPTEKKSTPTGCVATAMAQVMKFWNYPSKGTGSHSYTHGVYGKQSANFGATTYNWFIMPHEVTSPDKEAATLMYHCGVSVDMNYHVNGSGAYVYYGGTGSPPCAETALKTYFGYKSTMKGVIRKNYTEAQWFSLVKLEFDAGRPIIYTGEGTGAHAFIGDGYDNNSYLHFNWGWGGYYDGFFSINSLNPGSAKYTDKQDALIGIEPSTPKKYNPVITLNLKANKSKINYREGFSVTTNIANKGNYDMCGTYCVAIFDRNHKFIEYADSFQEFNCLTPNATYKNNLTFNFKGSDSLISGVFNLEMYFKPFGGIWQRVDASNNSISDEFAFEVLHPNYLYVYSEIKINRSELMQEEPVIVTLNLLNKERVTFRGQYRASLLNLDSSLQEIIDTFFETKGLVYNNSYPTPYLKFASSEIMSNPGKYLLAIQFKADSAKNWELAGSRYFKNIFEITVVPQPYKPDKYEINNTFDNSYALPVVFKNDTAEVKTTGSNLNKKSDLDYYKIVLPSGFNYLISARLQDAKSSDNEETYTTDAFFNIITSGGLWSDTYDSIIPNYIQVKGGATYYFFVSPDNKEGYGTYLLDIKITRIPLSAKDIIGFSVNEIIGTPFIDASSSTVIATINESVDLTSLTPNISISSFASINPGSGVAKDFTKPVKYTVTASDKSTKIWTVTLSKQSAFIGNRTSDLIKVYPNPSHDFIEIELSNVKLETELIQIKDMQGKTIPFLISRQNNTNYVLDIQGLNEGVYIIQLTTGQGIINKKIVITK
ncbi:MAG: C10 family peptidase [Bacteroidia bacterium]